MTHNIGYPLQHEAAMSTVENIALYLLEAQLHVKPDKAALLMEGRALTYRQLWERAHRFAAMLQADDLAVRSRAIIALPDSFSFVYAFFGCILAGVVPVLVGPETFSQNARFVLDDLDATLLITTEEFLTQDASTGSPPTIIVRSDTYLESLLDRHDTNIRVFEPNVDDVAFMLYTSGSTDEPKGVPHRHGDMPFTIEAFDRNVTRLTENDLMFCVSKLHFVYGLECSLCFPIHAGATAILLPYRPSPEQILQVLEKHKPTVFCCVPTLLNLMLPSIPDARAFESLRMCLSAGEALPPSTFDAWQSMTGLDLQDCMGSTETLSAFLANPLGACMPGSSGKLLPPFEAMIVDDNGKPVPPGEAGQLLVRGGSIAPYYWNRPEKTAETMLPDGWLRTGDIYVERDGYYFPQGRTNDLFKVDAQWVSPTAVENALRTHPAVRACAIAGRPVAGMLRPFAYIVPNPGIIQNGELLASMREHIAVQVPRHMTPARFIFVDAIPLTSTGKIQRFKL